MYILEGNIGAGKSTFLKLLAQHLPYVSASLEPMQNWQSKVYGQSLLANFYQEPKRWAYTLETLAMMCRVREHMQDQQYRGCKVVERSIYSGHYCFAKNSYASGFMSEAEWHAYNEWFNFLIPGKCEVPLGFIYLQVDPKVAYERIKKRNRHSEKKISIAYLKQIDQRHQEYLINKKGLLPEIAKVPILILNCDEEFEANSEAFKQHLIKVQQFIHKTMMHAPIKKSSGAELLKI